MLTSFEAGVSRHLGSRWYPFRSRPTWDPIAADPYAMCAIFSGPKWRSFNQCKPLLMAQPHCEQSSVPPKMQGSTRVFRSAE